LKDWLGHDGVKYYNRFCIIQRMLWSPGASYQMCSTLKHTKGTRKYKAEHVTV
jgi:hypothetical protein